MDTNKYEIGEKTNKYGITYWTLKVEGVEIPMEANGFEKQLHGEITKPGTPYYVIILDYYNRPFAIEFTDRYFTKGKNIGKLDYTARDKAYEYFWN